MERNRNTSNAQFGSIAPAALHDTSDRRARRLEHDGQFWKVQAGPDSFSTTNRKAAERRLAQLNARDHR